MKIEWRDVVGWEGIYEVSNHGDVRNTVTGKLRSTKGRVVGYPAVTLKKKGRAQQTILVHALVAAAFIGPRPLKYDVMHIDGSRTNNRLDNLRYGTRSENNMDKVNHGTDSRGEKHYQAKLTEDIVREIRQGGFTDKEWAKHLGVSRQTVQDARTGRTWGHLPLCTT